MEKIKEFLNKPVGKIALVVVGFGVGFGVGFFIAKIKKRVCNVRRY